MIFPVLELEATVQENDKTRLNANKSFISPDEAAITLVEIEPEAAAGFIDVTSLLYLDWQYATDGTKTVTVRVTTDGAPVSSSKVIEAVTSTDDKLFSSDEELVSHEPEILSYVRAGRNSFLDVHRTAQDRILTWLDENKFWDINDAPLTKDAIIDINEVNDWSKFLTLRLIFEGLSNATDDIFHEKAIRYKKMEVSARERAILRVDKNGDATVDANENIDLRSIEILRV